MFAGVWSNIFSFNYFTQMFLSMISKSIGYTLISIGYTLISIGYTLIRIGYTLISIGYTLISIVFR